MNKALREHLNRSKELGKETVTKRNDKTSLTDKLKARIAVMRSAGLKEVEASAKALKGKNVTEAKVERWISAVISTAVTAVMTSGARIETRIFMLCKFLPEAFQALKTELNLDGDDIRFFSDMKASAMAERFVPVAKKAGLEPVGWEPETCKGKLVIPGSVKPRSFSLTE